MRIDNPTADQIKPGDIVHLKPQVVKSVQPASRNYFVNLADWAIQVADIDYITREDTLEVGDEFTFVVEPGTFRARCMANAEGYVMYRLIGGAVSVCELVDLNRRQMQITKKAGAQ